ncbi:CpaB family Flp pilus assembly protein [Caballeronia peredens]|nr:CpaB family Flp pilus assembly protein [Caballeronia peredens]
MANASRIIALALFALAALFGLYAFSLTRAAPAPRAAVVTAPADPAVTVVVALRDLAPGRALAADDLGVRMQAAMPAGGFGAASVLIGRVPTVRIAQGDALTEGALASGLAASIQTGERAVAVRVDESNAVSNLVKPGDAVDVFIVMKRDPGADGEIPASHARLLLSKVRVLGFGDSTIAPAQPSADASVPNRAAARTAVLAVRVDDVDALSLAENSGRLLLALRNPADPDTHADSALASAKGQSPVARAAAGVSLAALTGGQAAGVARGGPLPPNLAGTPMLPPLPAALSTAGGARKVVAAGGVEVIRGTQRESVQNN